MSAWIPFFLMVAGVGGYALGWLQAHSTIAQECRYLGGFHVGKSVFRCTEKKHD